MGGLERRHADALAAVDDPAALDALAAFYTALARAAHAKAAQLRDDSERRLAAERRIDQLHRTGDIAWHFAQSMDDERAIAATVSQTGVPEFCVRAHLARRRREQAAADKAARDREIRTLAARGWTDREIAARVSLSTRQVRRIIAARPRPAAVMRPRALSSEPGSPPRAQTASRSGCG